MKKLISALTVKQAHKDGLREISAPQNTPLITPEARSVANELVLTLVENDSASSANGPAASAALPVDEKLVQQIVEKVIEQLPPEKRQPEVIKNVVVDVLSKYIKQG